MLLQQFCGQFLSKFLHVDCLAHALARPHWHARVGTPALTPLPGRWYRLACTSQVLLLNAAKDVASALSALLLSTKGASGKAVQDPAFVALKEDAKVRV